MSPPAPRARGHTATPTKPTPHQPNQAKPRQQRSRPLTTTSIEHPSAIPLFPPRANHNATSIEHPGPGNPSFQGRNMAPGQLHPYTRQPTAQQPTLRSATCNETPRQLPLRSSSGRERTDRLVRANPARGAALIYLSHSGATLTDRLLAPFSSAGLGLGSRPSSMAARALHRSRALPVMQPLRTSMRARLPPARPIGPDPSRSCSLDLLPAVSVLPGSSEFMPH